MTRLLITVAAFLLAVQTVYSQEEEGTYIRLVAGLDEPEEFYCVDIAGWHRAMALDDPMQTHTCKLNNGIDQMFHFEGEQIKAVNYDRCMEVAGSSGTTLAGSALLVRECTDDDPLQKFSFTDSGQLFLAGTAFCVVAGADSDSTPGPSHMWRTLSVANCDGVDSDLSTWQFGLD